MQDVIELFRQVIIQIATPKSIGTGFYVSSFGYIVTNFHVVEGCSEVVVSGDLFEKQVLKVVYFDAVYDVAFISPPSGIKFPSIEVFEGALREGDPVVAIGHPYGLKFSASRGIISKAQRLYNDINYIQLDAAINPGNSGGPLIDLEGNILGVNTFMIKDGNQLGFALPIYYLKDAIEELSKINSYPAVRCASCTNIVYGEDLDVSYCVNCGSLLPKWHDESESLTGVPKMIEEILARNGKNVSLSRSGPNRWEVTEGSATISIYYDQESGYIFSDALLCRIPKKNILEAYTFLLRENHKNNPLRFSVNNQDIVLSSTIFSQFLHTESTSRQLKDLFLKADYYDNVLVNEFGAFWKDRD